MLVHPPLETQTEIPTERSDLTDASGTLTTGGTSKQALAANTSRTYLLIQNPSEEDDLWVDFGVAAVQDQPSILLLPRSGALVFEQGLRPTQAVHVNGPTTGQPYTIKWA